MLKSVMVSKILVVWFLIASSNGIFADDLIKKDRRRMVVATSLFAAGVLTFNPVMAVAGTGMLGASTTGYIKHKIQAGKAEAASANPQPTQVASLVSVPDRPGYYYDPTNPNQLYFDQSQVANPIQTKPDGSSAATPARITVKIANAAKDGRSITFKIDETPFSVPPGYTQTLVASPGAVISFESGTGIGVERYTLTEGGFEFRSVENNWRFYNQEPARSVASGSSTTNPKSSVSLPR